MSGGLLLRVFPDPSSEHGVLDTLKEHPQVLYGAALALVVVIFVPSLAFLPLGRETRGLLLGAAVAVTVGAIDDFRGLAWWEKLAGQLGAAAIPVGFGIWVDRFTFPFLGIHSLPA